MQPYTSIDNHTTASFRSVLPKPAALIWGALGNCCRNWVSLVFTFMNLRAHAATSLIKSGVAGLCLDDHKSLAAANAMVDAWGCNDTAAQSWMPTDTQLIHNDTYCLAVLNDATVSGSRVFLAPAVAILDKSG